MGYIYLITNNINNKRYVGKTEKTPQERFKEHIDNVYSENDKNRPLYKALKKYGVDNFSLSILESNIPSKELAMREQYWIKKLDTYQKEYNATKGGDGVPLYDKEAIYQYYKQNNSSIIDTARHFDCDRRVVRNALREQGIINTPNEIKSIYQLDRDTCEIIQTFNSIRAAARFFHKTTSGLALALKDCWRTYANYRWCYCDNYDRTALLAKIQTEERYHKELKSKHLQKADIKDIVNFFYKGYSVKQITEYFQYHDEHVVLHKLQSEGISVEKTNIKKQLEKRQKLRKYNYKKIAEYYLSCKSIQKTCDYFSCKHDTVVKALKENKIKIYSSADVNRMKAKKIKQIDIQTNNIVAIYDSANEAAHNLIPPIKNGANILACCKGKQKTAYNFKWEYCETEEKAE